MKPLSLNGDWTLVHFAEGDHEAGGPEALQSLKLPEIQARVPGNVELDLVRAGALPEPYYADNIRLAAPAGDARMVVHAHLPGPGICGNNALECLVFEGLDTLATVWLNGVR